MLGKTFVVDRCLQPEARAGTQLAAKLIKSCVVEGTFSWIGAQKSNNLLHNISYAKHVKHNDRTSVPK